MVLLLCSKNWQSLLEVDGSLLLSFALKNRILSLYPPLASLNFSFLGAFTFWMKRPTSALKCYSSPILQGNAFAFTKSYRGFPGSALEKYGIYHLNALGFFCFVLWFGLAWQTFGMGLAVEKLFWKDRMETGEGGPKALNCIRDFFF